MVDKATRKLDEAQFKQLDLGIDAISGAINKLSEAIGPVDEGKSLYDGLSEGFAGVILALRDAANDSGKWHSLTKDEINAGFKLVAEAIAKGQTLPPSQPKPLEVTFVFKVANDHQDEPYSISIGSVTDAEGETLPDTKGLTVEVASSDEAVVAANFDQSTNSGLAHFGTSGVASLNATVKNAKGEILGSGAADFTVTTGDPAAVSDVKIAFSGITEEPTEPPANG